MRLTSLCCIALLLFTTMAWATEPAAPQSWTVSNLRGPVLSRETHLRLSVSKDGLAFADKKHKTVMEIPADQVVNVLYAPMSFSRAYQVGGDKTGDSGIGMPLAGCGAPGCGGALLMYLLVLAIASPMHGRSHYVQITWNDRGVEQQLQFEAAKENYTAVVAALKQLEGTKFMDVGAEADRLEAEITQNQSHAFELRLEHASKLGEYSLDAGFYKVLALDRGEGKADVYVFSFEAPGSIDPRMIKASARARVCDCPTGTSLDYLNDSAQIAAIQGEGRLFRFATE